jgi:hypothetical protein
MVPFALFQQTFLLACEFQATRRTHHALERACPIAEAGRHCSNLMRLPCQGRNLPPNSLLTERAKELCECHVS